MKKSKLFTAIFIGTQLLMLTIMSCTSVNRNPELKSVLWDKAKDIKQIDIKPFEFGSNSHTVVASIRYKNLQDPRQKEKCLVAFLTLDNFDGNNYFEEKTHM